MKTFSFLHLSIAWTLPLLWGKYFSSDVFQSNEWKNKKKLRLEIMNGVSFDCTVNGKNDQKIVVWNKSDQKEKKMWLLRAPFHNKSQA